MKPNGVKEKHADIFENRNFWRILIYDIHITVGVRYT